MNLAIGCDIVIATDGARFAELFVRRGLTIDFGGTWLLPRLVGLARARELALTGRMVGADEALAMGLVSRVVPAARLQDEASQLAEQLAAGPPLAQRFLKVALDRSTSMTFEQSLAFEDQNRGRVAPGLGGRSRSSLFRLRIRRGFPHDPEKCWPRL